MKRFLLCGVLLALLAGCGTAGEQLPEEVPEETAEVQEGAEPLSGEALTASAVAAYAKITQSLTFTLYVEEGSGAGWDLSITPENAWNVEGRENLFPISYQWSAASAADWAAQVGAMGEDDLLLEMASPDGATGLRCCTAGDVIAWTAAGGTSYAHAAVLPDQEPVSGLLQGIAEDALRDAAFSAPTVDGAETDYEEVARQLSEAMAENVRHVPDWVSWKPMDFRTGGVSVFDAYYGEPENFCAGLGFRLRLDSPDSAMANSWQAGQGWENRMRTGTTAMAARPVSRKMRTATGPATVWPPEAAPWICPCPPPERRRLFSSWRTPSS